MRAFHVLVVLGTVLVSAQCLEERYVRDVSELYSSPNIQTRPLYRPQDNSENSGYDYPRPAPAPQPIQPIVRPANRPEIIIDPVYPQPQPQVTYLQPRPQPQPTYPQPEFIRPQPIYPQSQVSYPQPRPQPQPTYPQPEFTRPQPIYPQPQVSYLQPRPQPTYPQLELTRPQPRPIYPQPNPIYTQPQPVYPQPTYPQPEVLLPSRPVPVIPEPELTARPNIGYDYPNPNSVDRVQATGAATGMSEKIFWPFTNKFGPPTNSYPGSNNIGYPNGNYPHKFSFLDSLFPFKNNYNGQRIEASSNQIASTSNFDQGFNNIGNNAVSSGGDNGYDYPNPNEQKPPFDLPGVIQFRKEPSNLK